MGAQPVAFPVRSSPRSELAEYDVARSVADLRDRGVTASVVCTDTSRHVCDAIELLELGPVLIEKPLASDLSQLGPLHEAVRRTGHPVHVAYHMRFDPGLVRMEAWLRDVGAIFSASIRCQSFLPEWRPGRDYRSSYSARLTEGGVLRDLSHELDYAAWLLGRPREVYAVLANSGVLGIEAEEAADLTWQLAGGGVAFLRLDYLSRVPLRRMEVVAEGGVVVWDALGGSVALRRPDGEVERFEFEPDRDRAMEEQAKAFLGLGGGRTPASLEEGAFAVAFADAARQSSEVGVPIHVGVVA